ncbi:hypothetical protein, partial [Methyloglobulus morosus]
SRSPRTQRGMTALSIGLSSPIIQAYQLMFSHYQKYRQSTQQVKPQQGRRIRFPRHFLFRINPAQTVTPILWARNSD